MSLRAPEFYWMPEPNVLARTLAPFGNIVGQLALRRMAKTGIRVSVPVVCIGNPVAGGAGKTPTALAMGQLLTHMGRCPIFLTRGYGGDNPGPLLVDRARHMSSHVGDEPLLLAAAAPTVVAYDRVAGAHMACSLGADIIIMDDGFQNPSLAKDIALLVIDSGVGIGNGLCLPAGPLRAPFDQQLARCDGVVLIGQGFTGDAIIAQAQAAQKPVYTARIVPEPLAAGRLAGQAVLAYAGIGRPQKFADTLFRLGAEVRLRAFPDHHRFTEKEAHDLMNEAHRDGLLLVTTEKDAARLSGDPALEHLRNVSDVLPIRLTFDDTRAVAHMLAAAR
jgi:tetraacyldisaccharide 4'-kinase